MHMPHLDKKKKQECEAVFWQLYYRMTRLCQRNAKENYMLSSPIDRLYISKIGNVVSLIASRGFKCKPSKTQTKDKVTMQL